MTTLDARDEIILNGIAFPLRKGSALSDTNLVTFPRKSVIGDTSKDADPLFSTWVTSDLTGGHGVDDLNESLDTTRYAYGQIYTRFPAQLSKPYATNLEVGFATSVDSWFLGDLKVGGVWNAIIHTSLTPAVVVYDGTTVSAGVGIPTTSPVNNSVVFRGTGTYDLIVTPMGASGYYTVSSNAFAFANNAASGTKPALVHAVVWDNKLIGIDVDGQLWSTTDATTWTSYGATAKLPTTEAPRKLISYFDRQGQPCIFVVSDIAVRQFDPSGPNLFDVDIAFPHHPNHGKAGTRWRGDMFFSVGMGVHKYTSGSLSAMGLDRDNGLPAIYNGYITDLYPGYNSLYALVQMPPSGTVTGGVSSLHEWTGMGWHQLWQAAPGDTVVPYSIGVSRCGDRNILIWGVHSATLGVSGWYSQQVPINFANPRQRGVSTGGFSSSAAALTTGIFDANMKGYIKVASNLDVSVTHLPAGESISVTYYLDDNAATYTTGVVLGTITATGTTSLPFGSISNGIYPGVPFKRIRFVYTMSGGGSNACIIESAVFSYIPTVPPSNTWTPFIDLSAPWRDKSPKQLKDALDDILEARVMVPLVHARTTYRVLVTQSGGSTESGTDERSMRQISLLEVPLSVGSS